MYIGAFYVKWFQKHMILVGFCGTPHATYNSPDLKKKLMFYPLRYTDDSDNGLDNPNYIDTDIYSDLKLVLMILRLFLIMILIMILLMLLVMLVVMHILI